MTSVPYIVEKFGRGTNLDADYDAVGDKYTPVVFVKNAAALYGADVSYVPVAQAVAGTTTVMAASATKLHKILGCVLILSAEGSLKFTDSAGDLTGAMDLVAKGGFVLPVGAFPYFQVGAVNRPLNIVTTGGAARGVVVVLTEI